MTDPIRPAVENLRQHQRQLDMDGIFVGVSRQALDEVLDYIEADREAIRADEVAKIVAWLRETAPQWGHEALADAIARGDHTGGGDGAV